MTQYQLLQGYSPNQTLVVLANPAVSGLAITSPSSPQTPGTALTCVFTFTNTGGDGTITFTLKNQLGATYGTVNVSSAAGTNGSGSIPFTMPTADVTLTVTSNFGGTASKAIQALLLVGTNLSLSFSPASATPRAPVTASGYLSRQDNPQNYTGVSGVTVQLLTSTGALIASGTTTSTGGYSIPFTAPATAGSYVYKAYFAGSGLLSASLAEGGLGVIGAVDYGVLPWLILGGIALVVLTDGGKKKRARELR